MTVLTNKAGEVVVEVVGVAVAAGQAAAAIGTLVAPPETTACANPPILGSGDENDD